MGFGIQGHPMNSPTDDPMRDSALNNVETLLRRFESYDPTFRQPITSFWPPPVRPACWNGNRRDVTAHSLHYNRLEISALLCRLDELGVGREKILVSDFYSGLSSLLWSERFREVHSISIRPFHDSWLKDGNFTIHFGRIGDMPFLYRAAARMGTLDTLLIDGTVRYDLAMILYYTFARQIFPGGVVVFLHAKPDGDPLNGIERLISDLRSGAADGKCHQIEDLNESNGLGIRYEVMK